MTFLASQILGSLESYFKNLFNEYNIKKNAFRGVSIITSEFFVFY